MTSTWKTNLLIGEILNLLTKVQATEDLNV